MHRLIFALPLSISSVLLVSAAAAQDASPSATTGPSDASDETAEPAPAQDKDGARFRGGVSASFGGIFGSEGFLEFGGPLGAVDAHLGVQINDLIGVYVVPHIAFGSVSVSAGPVSSSEGWLATGATAVVDFTFVDQLFVGVGGGAAAHAPTCTNCNGLSGGVLHLRLGGYPLVGDGDDGVRRQGLLLGGDLRINFLSSNGASITMIEPMATIGYEAF